MALVCSFYEVMIALHGVRASDLEVIFYGASCVRVKTDDLDILCDPWLLGTSFEGFWSRVNQLNNSPHVFHNIFCSIVQ